MRKITIDGVESFVFLEHLALDKGVVINILAPTNPEAPEDLREYVNHRTWIGPGRDVNEAAQLAVRVQGKAAYLALTGNDVAARVAEAKESIKPPSK